LAERHRASELAQRREALEMENQGQADGEGVLPPGWELDRLRHLGRGMLLGLAAGIITGVLVGGFGSRIAMRISAVLGGEEIAGLVTENGNVVGDITVDGTVGLLMFAGAFPGIAAGCLYVLIRRWLPGRRGWHGLLFGTLLLMTFGRAIINDDNADFTKLGPAAVNVTMFAMLFVLFGLLVAPLTGALDRRLPPVGLGMSRWFSRGYLVVVVPALPMLLAGVGVSGGLGGLGGLTLPVTLLVIAAYVWWPALRARVGFLRSGWTVAVLRIAPYAVISVAAIVGAVFLALNLPKMV
jgi:hypothetical protein